jgi:hypothetical protein
MDWPREPSTRGTSGAIPNAIKARIPTPFPLLADLRAWSGMTTEQLIYSGRASGRLLVPSLEPS